MTEIKIFFAMLWLFGNTKTPNMFCSENKGTFYNQQYWEVEHFQCNIACVYRNTMSEITFGGQIVWLAAGL